MDGIDERSGRDSSVPGAGPQLLVDAAELPPGSHCVSFHASREEAVEHAIRFLAGRSSAQASSYWVRDAALAQYYNERLANELPDQVGCVRALDGPQVAATDEGLRPIEPITTFLREHPGGVTAGGETISLYWTPETVPEYLEYERWFQTQPRDGSRFLCPYDLRRLPVDAASPTLKSLGRHHSHVVLSPSMEPGVRLLQLLVFPTVREVPEPLRSTLGWAREQNYLAIEGTDGELALTREGDRIVREWSAGVSVDW